MSNHPPRRSSRHDRRRFLTMSGAALLGSAVLPTVAQADTPALSQQTGVVPASGSNALPTRNLGRTGHKVGIFSLGGQAALERGHNEEVAVPIVERALDLGVNYID